MSLSDSYKCMFNVEILNKYSYMFLMFVNFTYYCKFCIHAAVYQNGGILYK